MKNSSLSRRALLVSLNISQWTGRKIDSKATATVVLNHHTELAAGSYHKKLLPKASELDKIACVVSKTRKFFYDNTLPWMSDGTRIISAKNHLKFSTEIRKLKSEFETAVKEFSVAYPKLKIDAEKALGDLYKNAEYPVYIDDKYSFEVSYLPMPDVKDFRIQVSELEKKEFETKLEQIEIKAMRDVWSRLHTVIKNAADKLAKPDSIFRDSLLENITELTAILPMLNISDDAELDKVSLEINTLVGKIRPDQIRDSKKERENAALELSKIEKNLSSFMGVK